MHQKQFAAYKDLFVSNRFSNFVRNHLSRLIYVEKKDFRLEDIWNNHGLFGCDRILRISFGSFGNDSRETRVDCWVFIPVCRVNGLCVPAKMEMAMITISG